MNVGHDQYGYHFDIPGRPKTPLRLRILYALRLKRRPAFESLLPYFTAWKSWNGMWQKYPPTRIGAIDLRGLTSDHSIVDEANLPWEPMHIVNSLHEIDPSKIKPGEHMHFAMPSWDERSLGHISITKLGEGK